MPEIITTFLTSLIAAIIGHIITQPIVDMLWERYKKDFQKAGDKSLGEENDEFNKKKDITAVAGIVERLAYAGGWLQGKPEIIAVILAMKTAPKLKAWEEDKMIGRTQFNIWMTGSLISLISAVFIAQLIKELLYIAPTT